MAPLPCYLFISFKKVLVCFIFKKNYQQGTFFSLLRVKCRTSRILLHRENAPLCHIMSYLCIGLSIYIEERLCFQKIFYVDLFVQCASKVTNPTFADVACKHLHPTIHI